MPKRTPTPPPGVDELSVPEQIEYVQGLWEQIVTSPKQCLHRTGTSISFVDAFRISSRILQQVDLGKRFGKISNSRSELVNPVDVFSTPV